MFYENSKKKQLYWLIGAIILIGIIITTYLLWPKVKNSPNTKSTPQNSQRFPKPIFPPPKPEEGDYNWGYLLLEMKNGAWKYESLTLNDKKITWSDFIDLLKTKNNAFFKFFQGMLKGLDSKLGAYFWRCPPVSKNTLNKPFEFVASKSESLNNITQNSDPFAEHIADIVIEDKQAISFSNLSRDSILVIPGKKWNGNSLLDYKNLTQFTKNAPEEQQQELWAEVANKLEEELEKDNNPRWLNTHGLGVRYLHVRIDWKPKYYGDYEEYKKGK